MPGGVGGRGYKLLPIPLEPALHHHGLSIDFKATVNIDDEDMACEENMLSR